jgi:hypothetical protein
VAAPNEAHPGTKWVVDRRGVEPLTSAVQRPADKLRAPQATDSFIGVLGGVYPAEILLTL